MEHNAVIERLGLGPGDKAVIVHVDDVGMCHATIPAALDLVERGTVSSLSLMAPCPWFDAAVEALAAVEVDLGVHLTLTSEWRQYRWSPLTPHPELRDDAGRFPHTCEQVQGQASPEAVRGELEAQIDAASTLSLTHVDSHMGAIATPDLLPVAVEVALDRGLVPFVPRWDAPAWRRLGLDAASAERAADHIARLAQSGLPMVDHVRSLPLDHADDHRGYLLRLLDELPPGVTHLYCHPALDTPELRAICPDWAARVENHAALASDGLAADFARRGVTLTTYGALREAMRP